MPHVDWQQTLEMSEKSTYHGHCYISLSSYSVLLDVIGHNCNVSSYLELLGVISINHNSNDCDKLLC